MDKEDKKNKLVDSIRYTVDKAISFIPVKVFTSFLGFGHLPVWQNHWTAFFAIVIFGIALELSIGIESVIIEIGTWLFFASLGLLIIGLFSITILKLQEKGNVEYDKITIHVAFGQIFSIFLSIPSIIIIIDSFAEFYANVCKYFIYCSEWFYEISLYSTSILMVYASFRITDILKPWPSGFLEVRYNNAATYMLESFFNAVYAALLIYLISFMFLGLRISDVIKLYSAVFLNVKYKLGTQIVEYIEF